MPVAGLFLCFIGMPLLGCTDIWTNLAQAQGWVKEMVAQYLLISMAGLPAALGGRAFVALNAVVSRPKVTMYVSLCDGDFKSTAKRRFYVRLVWF